MMGHNNTYGGDMMEDKLNNESIHQEPNCPICGKNEYQWGELRVGKNPPGEFVYYRPSGMGMTWEDDYMTFVRRCLNCENLQIFANS
jgi:hypothetical protein